MIGMLSHNVTTEAKFVTIPALGRVLECHSLMPSAVYSGESVCLDLPCANIPPKMSSSPNLEGPCSLEALDIMSEYKVQSGGCKRPRKWVG